jgi:hypothetical protein
MGEVTVGFVRSIAARSARLRAILDEHIKDNFGEILPHVFFGDLTRHVVSLCGSAGSKRPSSAELQELHEILEMLEEAYAKGDNELQELISVSFLEHLPRPDESGSEIRTILGPRLSEQLAVIG